MSLVFESHLGLSLITGSQIIMFLLPVALSSNYLDLGGLVQWWMLLIVYDYHTLQGFNLYDALFWKKTDYVHFRYFYQSIPVMMWQIWKELNYYLYCFNCMVLYLPIIYNVPNVANVNYVIWHKLYLPHSVHMVQNQCCLLWSHDSDYQLWMVRCKLRLSTRIIK